MKMNLKTLFFSIFYLITLTSTAQASAIKQMYEVSLPVVTQEAQIRNAAFEQGLIEVSVRVSGTSMAPTQIDLGQASRMVRQYRYQTLSQAEIDSYVKHNKSLVAPKYRLWIQFDGLAISCNGFPGLIIGRVAVTQLTINRTGFWFKVCGTLKIWPGFFRFI